MTIKCKDCYKSTSSSNELCGNCMGDRIVLIIDRDGPMTRTELVRYTGLPRSTIYDCLEKLQSSGRLVASHMNIGRGRPRTVWNIPEN